MRNSQIFNVGKIKIVTYRETYIISHGFRIHSFIVNTIVLLIVYWNIFRTTQNTL